MKRASIKASEPFGNVRLCFSIASIFSCNWTSVEDSSCSNMRCMNALSSIADSVHHAKAASSFHDFTTNSIKPGAFRQRVQFSTESFARKRLRDRFHGFGGFITQNRRPFNQSFRHDDGMICDVAKDGGVTECHFSLQEKNGRSPAQDGSDPVRVYETLKCQLKIHHKDEDGPMLLRHDLACQLSALSNEACV